MKLAVVRAPLPLAIAAVAFLFLGLFFLYPLYRVFGASFLDASGAHFTLH
ncbi:MAG: hypothetical protein V7640_4002, partial [Betaproteobacteria bacterium]